MKLVPEQFLKKIAKSRFLTASVAFHMLLLFFIGGVVLFKSPQRDIGFFKSQASDGILQELNADLKEEAPPEFEEPASLEPASTVSQASAISALATVSLTTWQIAATPGPMSIGDRILTLDSPNSRNGGGNLGSNAGKFSGGSGKMAGTLFGMKIESKKLGVILDISASTHSVLHLPLEAIQRQFKGTVIVLYPGCGMKSDAPADAYPVRRWKSVKEDEKDRPKFRSSIGQLLAAAKINPSLETLLKAPNVYIVDHREDKTLCFGAQYAFAELERQDVDTIYWFADFRDALDDDVMSKVAQSLKQKKIKVIFHDFAGVFRNEKQEKSVRGFARSVNGEILLVKPN